LQFCYANSDVFVFNELFADYLEGLVVSHF
jgi:hypothetical protein